MLSPTIFLCQIFCQLSPPHLLSLLWPSHGHCMMKPLLQLRATPSPTPTPTLTVWLTPIASLVLLLMRQCTHWLPCRMARNTPSLWLQHWVMRRLQKTASQPPQWPLVSSVFIYLLFSSILIFHLQLHLLLPLLWVFLEWPLPASQSSGGQWTASIAMETLQVTQWGMG